MDIELEDDIERERLKKAMEKVPKGHHEEDEFKVNKASEKFYMISLEKSRRKRSKEFRECVHYGKKFEEVQLFNLLILNFLLILNLHLLLFLGIQNECPSRKKKGTLPT